jgi:hypothetical protein
MPCELWLFFQYLAQSPDQSDRDNCIMLELETDTMHEMIEKIPTEYLTSEQIFVRGFPNRVEIECKI